MENRRREEALQTMKKQAYNPYLPAYEYVPDGEPHLFEGRVYLYGSHDRFGGTDFCMNNYVCWSAPADDLADWRYEGESYNRAEDPWCTGEECRVFAPDVARGPDGRYYLYYGIDFLGKLSVAVASEPAGPFHFYAHLHHPDGTPLGAAPGDAFQYDPGVLVDDDGTVYLVSGFCPVPGINPRFEQMHLRTLGCQLFTLAPDMCTVISGPCILAPQASDARGTDFEEHPFFEAPSLRKVGNRYYLIYSSTQNHELCYATAAAVTGPYRFGGTLISNGDLGLDGRTVPLNYTGTNHGSIIQVADRWYVFYHRQTNRTPYARQGCAEPIRILSDGRIPQVRITSCGLNGGPLQAGHRYPAGIACCLQGRDGAAPYRAKTAIGSDHPYITQDKPDGDPTALQYIANLRDGARAGFRSFELTGGPLTIVLRGTGLGVLEVSGGEKDLPVLYLPVQPNTVWHEVTGPLPLQGEQDLWLTWHGTGHLDLLALYPETGGTDSLTDTAKN